MKNSRPWFQIAALVVALVVFVVVLERMFAQLSSPRTRDTDSIDRLVKEAWHEELQREVGGTPVIAWSDLDFLPIEVLQRIKPQFEVLAAALVHLRELREQYESAELEVERRRIQMEATSYFAEAAFHERQIDAMLPAEHREWWDRYLERQEAAAGLPPDPRHRARRPGGTLPARGFHHPDDSTVTH